MVVGVVWREKEKKRPEVFTGASRPIQNACNQQKYKDVNVTQNSV